MPGAFKNIYPQDKVLVPYVANKPYSLDYTDASVQYYTVSLGNPLFDVIQRKLYPLYISGTIPYLNQRLQASNYKTVSAAQPSGSYISDINISKGQTENSTIYQVVSIAQSVCAEGIQPGSVSIYIAQNNDDQGGDPGLTFYGADDSNGNLYVYDNDLNQNVFIGNIIYNQGLIVITDSTYFFGDPYNGDGGDFQVSFNNTYTLYEQTYRLKIKQNDFNLSYNPTLLVSGSSNVLQSFVTGSFFEPYITGIGLYSPDNQLMAVAKFGQPIPMSSNTDFNINIKLDL